MSALAALVLVPAAVNAVAPSVTTSGESTPYTENETAVIVDNALTVSDPDDPSLVGATVRVASGFQAGDDLVFDDTAQITGTYNSGTGVLTLTGTATVADYQAARSGTATPGTLPRRRRPSASRWTTAARTRARPRSRST